MLRTINERRLRDHLGKSLHVEREGIKGNLFSELGDGQVVAKEGVLWGVLCKDERGFYIKMYKTYWGKEGTVFNKTEFFDEPYRSQNGDIIRLYAGERVVRLSTLETG